MSDPYRTSDSSRSHEPHSAEQLLPLVYEELRKLAAARISQETPGQTLQPTALVHEAYLRLVATAREQTWDNRGHFFAAAAEAMRRILVDQARRKSSEKHGGRFRRRQTIENGPNEQRKNTVDQVDLLSLDEALTRLEEHDAVAARLVKLRYFGGASVEQAAELLNISPRSAYYAWTYARSWLRHAIEGRTESDWSGS